jgi:hypothetical protein
MPTRIFSGLLRAAKVFLISVQLKVIFALSEGIWKLSGYLKFGSFSFLFFKKLKMFINFILVAGYDIMPQEAYSGSLYRFTDSALDIWSLGKDLPCCY